MDHWRGLEMCWHQGFHKKKVTAELPGFFDFLKNICLPGTQMTLVLIGKGLVLGG